MKEFKEMDKLKKDLFEAIDTICQDYEKNHKEPKPEFKVGDWIISLMSHGNEIQHIKSISDNCVEYDMGCSPRYPHGHYSWRGYIRHATKDEIESHLKKICDEKYPVGTKYKSLVYGDFAQVKGIFRYFIEGDYMTDGFGGCVYDNGKFAEILPDKKKLPKTKAEFNTFLGAWANRHTSTTDEFLNDYE